MQGEIEYNRGGTGVSFCQIVCKKPSVCCGGVLDAEKNYVKASEMNAYAKYAVPVTAQDEKEIYLGEGYTIDDKKVEYLDEEIIYLGYINNHWGHFLIDCSTRLYYYLEHMDENHKYAFLVNENEYYQAIAPIRRFFELLGIAECLIFIHKVTRCKKVIIPEQGYMINAYYSKQVSACIRKGGRER